MCILSFITDPSESFRIRFRHVAHEWRYELLISSSLSSVSGALKIKNFIENCKFVPLDYANCLRWKYQRVFPCVLKIFGSNLWWIIGCVYGNLSWLVFGAIIRICFEKYQQCVIHTYWITYGLAYLYAYIYIYIYMHTYIHTCMLACIHTYIHTYLFIIHIYIYIQVLTYIHTCIRPCMYSHIQIVVGT